MKWASAISLAAGVPEAVAEIASKLDQTLDGARPDLILVFASPHHAAEYHEVPRAFGERFEGAVVVGGSGAGVIGGRREIEHRSAIAVIAASLPGVTIGAHHINGDVPDDLPAFLGSLVEDTRALVVLLDPFTADAGALVRALDASYPNAPKIGGLVSGGRQVGANALFVNGTRQGSGAVIVTLAGALKVETVIAQGCRPIGEPMLVTACDENVVLELNSEKPVEHMQRLYNQLDERDRTLFETSLFFGIEMKDQVEYQHGDWLIRNIIGFDRQRGGLIVAANVPQWSAVQFHLRDARASADDLVRMLERYAKGADHAPAGALLFSCLGRGAQLYGEPDHDSGAFFARVGDVPLAGFFGNGEIGPVGNKTFLHGYTSAFGIFSKP